jgi:diketogulonate reductase-like aldo/keto reductase
LASKPEADPCSYFVQQGMIDVCKAYNIHMMAYSSFGPQSYVT